MGFRLIQPGIVKTSPKQSGRLSNFKRDVSRKALPPGKRLSASGKPYWETRRNRTDLEGSY